MSKKKKKLNQLLKTQLRLIINLEEVYNISSSTKGLIQIALSFFLKI